MKTIHKALLEAQKVITHATKDATNPHFKSKYATLESVIDAVKKPLNDVGIYITHSTSIEGNLMTSLIHAESGESIVSQSPLIMNRQDMQQLGSAQTYAKRFNLTALLNLPTEDDDGNTVSQPVKEKPQAQLQKPKQLNDGVYMFKVGKQTKGKAENQAATSQ